MENKEAFVVGLELEVMWICVCFSGFAVRLVGSSPTRDQTWVTAVKAVSPNNWTTREFPMVFNKRAEIGTWQNMSVIPNARAAGTESVMRQASQKTEVSHFLGRNTHTCVSLCFGNCKTLSFYSHSSHVSSSWSCMTTCVPAEFSSRVHTVLWSDISM